LIPQKLGNAFLLNKHALGSSELPAQRSRFRRLKVIKSIYELLRHVWENSIARLSFMRSSEVHARQAKKPIANDSTRNAAGKWRVFYSFSPRTAGWKARSRDIREIYYLPSFRSVSFSRNDASDRSFSRWCWYERMRDYGVCVAIIARTTTNGARGRINYVNYCVAELFVSWLYYVICDRSLSCHFTTVHRCCFLLKRIFFLRCSVNHEMILNCAMYML